MKKGSAHNTRRGFSPPNSLPRAYVVRLLDVKQNQNKEGKTVLCLVFEYMEIDLKKFIHVGGEVPPETTKICKEWPSATMDMVFYIGI